MSKEELINQILSDCIESGLSYNETISALQKAEWHFLSRAETALRNMDIKTISALDPTCHIQALSIRCGDNRFGDPR